MTIPSRLIVFIDYQNAYMSARETFGHQSSHYTRGQIDPWALGESIVKLDDQARKDGETSVLHQVRLYFRFASTPQPGVKRTWRATTPW